MHFVLDFGLQVEFFEQARNLLLDICYLATALHDLILNGFLDCPESVAVFDILEDELTLFSITEIHIGSAALQSGLAAVSRRVHKLR